MLEGSKPAEQMEVCKRMDVSVARRECAGNNGASTWPAEQWELTSLSARPSRSIRLSPLRRRGAALVRKREGERRGKGRAAREHGHQGSVRERKKKSRTKSVPVSLRDRCRFSFLPKSPTEGSDQATQNCKTNPWIDGFWTDATPPSP